MKWIITLLAVMAIVCGAIRLFDGKPHPDWGFIVASMIWPITATAWAHLAERE
jgi:hypothetical protein